MGSGTVLTIINVRTVEVCVLHRPVLTLISLCGQWKYGFCIELCSQ